MNQFSAKLIFGMRLATCADDLALIARCENELQLYKSCKQDGVTTSDQIKYNFTLEISQDS